MTGNRRFSVIAMLGSLVTVVLCAGVIGAAALEGEPPRGEGGARAAAEAADRLAADAATTTAVGPATTATEARPTDASSNSSPTTPRPVATTKARGPAGTAPTTATTRPAPRTTTTAPARTTRTTVASDPTRADYGRVGPQTVVFPYSAGRTTWTATSNGINITVRIDKAAPRAGEPIQFDMEMDSPTGGCCNARLHYGDHAEYSPTGPCFPPGPGAPVKTSTGHVYYADGRWTFWARAISGDCQSPRVEAGLMGTIQVAPAPASGQGPSKPTVTVNRSSPPAAHPTDPSWASVVAQARDADGWIRSLTLDWGDGSPRQEFGGDGMGCRPDAGGWPLESRKSIFTDEAIHHYAEAGSYTIRATVVSTACDGSDPQQATGSLAWWVPAS